MLTNNRYFKQKMSTLVITEANSRVFGSMLFSTVPNQINLARFVSRINNFTIKLLFRFY